MRVACGELSTLLQNKKMRIKIVVYYIIAILNSTVVVDGRLTLFQLILRTQSHFFLYHFHTCGSEGSLYETRVHLTGGEILLCNTICGRE